MKQATVMVGDRRETFILQNYVSAKIRWLQTKSQLTSCVIWDKLVSLGHGFLLYKSVNNSI